MYFPNVLPFKVSLFEPSEEPIQTQQVNLETKESSMSEGNSAFGNLVGSSNVPSVTNVVKPVKSLFNGCIDEKCASFSTMSLSDSTTSSVDTGTHTVFYCVNKNMNGVDMTKYDINFSIEDDLYNVIPSEKVSTVMNLYTKKEPIQYEVFNSTITWVAIYLENCNDIK